MRKFFLVLLILIVVMVGSVYAGETLKDEKGFYELNSHGSKCRLSDKDYDLKKQGLPYGLTLSDTDMSETEKAIRAQEAIQAAAKVKANEISALKQQIIDLSMQNDKAQSLGFTDVVNSLTTQITEKQDRLKILQGG